MKEGSIGLFNAAYGNDCRLKLNLLEVPGYSLFEGEIIVAEGFMDTKKFNVNRIWKPAMQPSNPEIFTEQEIKTFQSNQADKAIEIMLACGPFTINNELSYEALKDLMQIVNRDKPHVLMLSGPFVSQNHEDISSGDLRYRDQETEELKFMDTDQLFTQIMNYIYSQMTSLKNT